MDRRIELVPLELAGRGDRLQEPFYNTFDEATDDLYHHLASCVDKPYILFGHCMGAVLCYELAVRLFHNGNHGPAHIIISGQAAPENRNGFAKLYKLSDEELIKSIQGFGADPHDKLSDKEVADFFLPILRADCKIFDDYCLKQKIRLPYGFTIISGKNDPFNSASTLLQWQEYTTKDIAILTAEGNHFYLNHDTSILMNHINEFASRTWIKNKDE